MKLNELLKNVEVLNILGNAEVEISGVSSPDYPLQSNYPSYQILPLRRN